MSSKINSAGKLYDIPDDPRIAQLEAENESYKDWAERMRADNGQLAAENKRLRAALEKILAHSMHQNAVEQIVRETLWPT